MQGLRMRLLLGHSLICFCAVRFQIRQGVLNEDFELYAILEIFTRCAQAPGEFYLSYRHVLRRCERDVIEFESRPS